MHYPEMKCTEIKVIILYVQKEINPGGVTCFDCVKLIGHCSTNTSSVTISVDFFGASTISISVPSMIYKSEIFNH